MTTLNWRDVQEQAELFIPKYQDAKDEDRDAKPFWKDLLKIYNIDARQIGAFEERVRIHGRPGVAKIDYFAPGKFIIEHKSRGKNLDVAYKQALDYFDALPKTEQPRFIVVSDFARIRVYDLEASEEKRITEFALEELPKRVSTSLAFFADEEVRVFKPEEPIDVKAVRAIGKLHLALKTSNYTEEHLSPLLTRIVFCCFADDTGIFERDVLRQYLEENTKEDGSDIGSQLSAIFNILNTPVEQRQSNIHSALENLPYVNGGLFSDRLNVVFANREIRETLLAAMAFDWSKVSPAIFGSMFQSVMDEQERHDLGAHYTSEKNIMKVIGPLFLDTLHDELDAAKTSKEKLEKLWEKVSSVTLLDPACGCGNFLVVAYRELRHIENEIIARLYKKDAQKVTKGGAMVLPMDVDTKKISRMSVERMYGIEIDPFPAEVAKLSLWLMDHQMNMELGALFGKPLRKLPLTEAPHIVQGNALLLDWEEVVPKEKLSYILGNPPFLGARVMSVEQKADMVHVFGKAKGLRELDFVTAWYKKAAEYIQSTSVECAFVSTNSISQGEQVAILWNVLKDFDIHIRFAHRTFKWSNEATGKAAVYCVIIGFGRGVSPQEARLFHYENVRGEASEEMVEHINGYLVAAPDALIDSRKKPLADVPEAVFGSMPNDGGNFIFNSTEEKDQFLVEEPAAEPYIRKLVGAKEFLQGGQRWCLWLKDASPETLRAIPGVMRRVEAVKLLRSMSPRAGTKKLADTPYLWGEDRQPNVRYILIPRVSSEQRHYIPMGFFSPEQVAGDTCIIVPNATLYHFGVLESEMHMAWMRSVAGRLKSDYRYSKDIVYNNFPWPEADSTQKESIEAAAQAVLDARGLFPDATLADLYDPNTMPQELLKAHHKLDRVVDICYGKAFNSEPERLELLFDLYKNYSKK